MKQGLVIFPGARVLVEIPQTDAERMAGLSYRTYLAPDAGMLFDFGKEGLWSMTMDHTNLSLDMVFFDQTEEVVYLIENAHAHTPGSFTTARLARYVLEVNAGWVARNGVVVGSRAVIS